MILLRVMVNSEFGRSWDLEATVSHRCEMPPVSCLAASCFMPLATFPKPAFNLFLFYVK